MTLSVKMNIDGLTEICEKLRQAQVDVDALGSEIVDNVLSVVLESAQRNAPSPTSQMYPTASTGFLRDSHKVYRTGPYSGVMKPEAHYAWYVHQGYFHHVGAMGHLHSTRFKSEGIVHSQWIPARPWLQATVSEITRPVNELVRRKVLDSLITALSI